MTQAFIPYVIDEAGTKVELPQPLHSFTKTTNFKRDSHGVPVSPGETSFGHSVGVTQFTIEGEAYKDTSGVIGVEDAAFDAIDALYDLFAGITVDNKLMLVLYNDGVSYWRWYDDVVPDSFTHDMGDGASEERQRHTYNLTLTAQIPGVKKTTAPDEA